MESSLVHNNCFEDRPTNRLTDQQTDRLTSLGLDASSRSIKITQNSPQANNSPITNRIKTDIAVLSGSWSQNMTISQSQHQPG